jgi:hypothetical protein
MRGHFGETSALHAAAIAPVCDEHCLQIPAQSQELQVLFRNGRKIALFVPPLVATTLTVHSLESTTFCYTMSLTSN